MVLAFTVKADTEKLKDIAGRGRKLNSNIGDSTFKSATVLAQNIRRQYMMQTNKAPRTQTASRIYAKKLSNIKSVIRMPLKAYFLDTMRPHFISIKRGRIARWARKYYGPDHFTAGLSRVSVGPKGARKGFLYVTPDPFVDKAVMRSMPRIMEIYQRTIQKALAGGG